MPQPSKPRKLAVLLITTHGNLDTSMTLADDGKSVTGENLIKHDGEINVHKINATTDGVCNWTSPDSLNEMIGTKMNKYIALNKEEEKKTCNRNGITYNPDNILCLWGTDTQQQKQILDFSRSLAKFMPMIDGIRSETMAYVKKTAKGKQAELKAFDEDSLVDPDLHRYIEQLDGSYQLEKWGTDALYSDKIYTIIRSELVGEEVSSFDNTMTLLGNDTKLGLSDLPIGPTTRRKTKGDNITFMLSEILAKLKELKYTDTIIIDLSCNAAYDARTYRSIKKRKRGGKKTKKNRKKPSNKKRRQKQKTTRKKKV
jgi:hypothetical protein